MTCAKNVKPVIWAQVLLRLISSKSTRQEVKGTLMLQSLLSRLWLHSFLMHSCKSVSFHTLFMKVVFRFSQNIRPDYLLILKKDKHIFTALWQAWLQDPWFTMSVSVFIYLSFQTTNTRCIWILPSCDRSPLCSVTLWLLSRRLHLCHGAQIPGLLTDWLCEDQVILQIPLLQPTYETHI